MECRAKKSRLSGVVSCPPSKSYTHRAIFLASLAGNSIVRNALYSADTTSTMAACSKLGAAISEDASTITVGDPISPAGITRINAGNSGTTMRIAAGIAGLFPFKSMITGDESLNKRPMQILLDALEQMGARCTSVEGHPPVSVRGAISGGDVTIPGNVSSQFVSSLLMCAPLAKKGMRITIKDKMVSRPYLDATISAMKQFGGTVSTVKQYKRYEVSPGSYSGCTFDVPSDASSLALLLSAAVLVGDLKITCDLGGFPQGDAVFVKMLESMGVRVEMGKVIRVTSPERLSGGIFDLGDTPDLLPPLAILALKTSAPITITNVGHARVKETDRLAIIASELAKTGITIQENSDGLVLEPAENHTGAEFDSHNDHRLFMAFCIAGMYVGDCTISDSESAAVSYPNFISEMARLGADIRLA
ncbi:MAG: 3-phosphoshikimate 1-carboxyvinyltransferase [Nitrosopumilus sp. B06]|nr:MAG: 3-phosphoshikimate 1-carboxyvinyltransferase [Nitrosopumilus sp. B06]